MRVFNLAEELEKERKKNKELEERNEVLEKRCKEYRYHIKQMNKIHDNCLNTIEELQDRIDSALSYIYDHYDLGTEKEVSFCILRDRVLERLKGSDNND